MKWEIQIDWMDGGIRVIGNIGQFGPGVFINGALMCYTKEHRMAESKLTEVIPMVNVRRFTIKEVNW